MEYIIHKNKIKLEHSTPMIAKKMWNLIRVAFYMLRKSICKRKLLLDLNLIMKRGKIAGKTLQRNLMFFNQHQRQRQHRQQGFGFEPHTNGLGHHLPFFNTAPPGEYEFSCSNTPLYRQYFTNKKKQHNHNSNLDCFYTPYSSFEDFDNGIEVFHDMLNSPRSDNSMASSPTMSGLGFRLNSRAVRQLRITDSPFPLQSTEDGDGGHVDAAAQDFINKFYSQLKKQNYY